MFYNRSPALTSTTNPAPPPGPDFMLSLGVTGHRLAHPAFLQNRARIEAVLNGIFDGIEAANCGAKPATRLHCLIADGTDQLAAEMALAREYELVCPLPFGRRLNKAINALPINSGDARSLLAGGNSNDPATQDRADSIRTLADRAHLFALADQDQLITQLFLAKLDAPSDLNAAQAFSAECSRRVALAGRVLIEQSDILIAVWDGKSTAHIGGTGHTVAIALELGAPVIWIDPATPEAWQLLLAPEALAKRSLRPAEGARNEAVAAIVRGLATSDDSGPKLREGSAALARAKWRGKSHWITHAYRRIEALFGSKKGQSPFRNITKRYERPDEIGSGSGAATLQAIGGLPDGDTTLSQRIEQGILHRFAWADGVSSRLSDSYRGGMTVNFILSAFAIVGGMAYLPFASSDQKWVFAVFELILLGTILVITSLGRHRHWHSRWFETRRVAEYLRHSPLLLALGVARAPGRWPQGTETSWPELQARQAIREVGLPRATVTPAYLRAVLDQLISRHVTSQRDYHVGKAKRLAAVHHRLDLLSNTLFRLAVGAVALYLVLKLGSITHIVDHERVAGVSKLFTWLGVLLPTFGGAIAGIRYFGDFERFAAISQMTAEKLDHIHRRIALLDGVELEYDMISALAHATDDVVISEIENWQAVFGGKQIAVPV